MAASLDHMASSLEWFNLTRILTIFVFILKDTIRLREVVIHEVL